ncbi:MAG: GxxExxY protein [Gammaproteobacteria bacterium]
MDINDLSSKVIGASIEVHRHLGPGLLESAYQQCLVFELEQQGLKVATEVMLPLTYKGLNLEHGYRIDLLVEGQLVVELKAVDNLMTVNVAQILSYLKMGNYKLGLLINFNVPQLKQGVKRIINN